MGPMTRAIFTGSIVGVIAADKMAIITNNQSFSPNASGLIIASFSDDFKIAMDTVILGLGRDITIHLPPTKSACPNTTDCIFNSTYKRYMGWYLQDLSIFTPEYENHNIRPPNSFLLSYGVTVEGHSPPSWAYRHRLLKGGDLG